MLEVLRVEDWKSFEEAELTFTAGTNLIFGTNFSGKTSLLEAISFALFGTVPDPALSLTHLIRAGAERAQVELKFSANGQSYLVRRTISGKKRVTLDAHLYDERGTELQAGPKEVTAKIEELLGVTADYFLRAIYMPEGFIHSFLTKPPKKGIKEEIDKALGISSLMALSNLVKNIAREADIKLKNLEHQARSAATATAVQEDYSSLAEEESKLEGQVEKLESQLDTLASREELEHSLKELQQALDRLLEGILGDGRVPSRLEQAIAQAREKTESLEERKDKIMKDIAKVETELKSEREHLRILEEAAARGLAKCPVCEADLSPERASALITRRKVRIGELDEELKVKRAEHEKTGRELLAARSRLSDLLGRKGEFDAKFEDLRKLTKRLNEVKRQTQGLNRETVEHDLKAAREQLEDVRLRKARAEASARIQHEILEEGIRRWAHVHYLAKEVQKALDQTAKELREAKANFIKDEAGNSWTSLMGGGPWTFGWDDKFIPTVTLGGQTFHTRQLSGAEKLFVLFSLRTAFAKTLGNPGFLLFDEPAEHLDQNNQQLVSNALKGVSGEVGQILIATCKPALKEAGWDRVFQVHKRGGASQVISS